MEMRKSPCLLCRHRPRAGSGPFLCISAKSKHSKALRRQCGVMTVHDMKDGPLRRPVLPRGQFWKWACICLQLVHSSQGPFGVMTYDIKI